MRHPQGAIRPTAIRAILPDAHAGVRHSCLIRVAATAGGAGTVIWRPPDAARGAERRRGRTSKRCNAHGGEEWKSVTWRMAMAILKRRAARHGIALRHSPGKVRQARL